jgi:nucleotide-binding universal stress UspA family protein
MFQSVIVGVDEHQGGSDAIALAAALVEPDGELTLAYVYLGDPARTRGSSPAFEATERKRALELLEAAREHAGVSARLACTPSPSVGRGLHELAETHSADLLIIGSCRRGLIGRVLVGDDTHAALNGAPCAVAVAPSGYARKAPTMDAVGVGYDGSSESEYALAVARRLASRYGARVAAFRAISLAAYLFSESSQLVDESIPTFIEEARGQLAELGDVEPHAAYGSVVEELALFSASIDLLLVGSREYGPIGRLVHSSTSQELARVARCPLLVLTRAARAREEHVGDSTRETTRASTSPANNQELRK